MKLGIEVLLEDKKLIQRLKNKRIGLVGHPASVGNNLIHSLDLISNKLSVSCAFGPQHGIRGEKQDNMIESEDFIDTKLNIPIFSLYGKVRKPTPTMMEHFDVLLFDLQDLGCRIYTFITTLHYLLEACKKHRKTIIILDRPNPAGRPVEGFRLQKGWESFVGSAPLPMRHGLTVGELAQYYNKAFEIDADLVVVKMKSYKLNTFGKTDWPKDRAWINPSPNAANLNMARVYSGTVLLEGTTLSEGRGTTRPLEVVGAPDIDANEIYLHMNSLAPEWLKGCLIRPCYFEPCFHKHSGKLCSGLQIHTDHPSYQHRNFKPFRIISLFLKSLRSLDSKYPIYRDFAYEYVENKLPFDTINGGPRLREWIESTRLTHKHLDKELLRDEKSWENERKKFLLY